jgi:hypothetical protein
MPRDYSFFSNNNIVKYALLRGFTNYEDALSSQIQSIDWLCGNEFKVKEPKQAIVLSGNPKNGTLWIIPQLLQKVYSHDIR